MSVLRFRSNAEEAWQSIPTIRGEKGDAFTYEDFTAEQLEGLRGPQGPQGIQGEPGEDFIPTADDVLSNSEIENLINAMA